ncbi:MAG: ABC transporter substrate-binding protein [Defluviitaleaceae bacterium]|nr:ABC transporter substrate-binding protein [Defluviitaleaceae bacterium]
MFKKFKKIFAGFSMLALSAVLVACGAAATPDPDPVVTPPEVTPPATVEVPVEEAEWTPAEAGDVTIRFSWWGVEDRAILTEQALDVFRARYPNVTILTEWSAFGGHLDNLTLQLATGEEPDLMQVNYAWIHSLSPGGNNAFLDLNTVAHVLDLTEWSQDDLAFLIVGDELAAVPYGQNGRVVVYNRLLLQEFGLSEFPTTTEDLIAFGTLVSEGNNLGMDLGYNRHALANLDNLLFDLATLTWLYNTTGRTLQEGGQLLHTVEEVQAIFDLIGVLQETGTVPNPLQETAGFPNHNDPIWTEGRAGGALVWVSDVHNFFNTFMGGDQWDDLGVALLPTPAGYPQITMQRPSFTHAISRNTDHPEVVAYLLNFLYTDPLAIVPLAQAGGIPFSTTASYYAQDVLVWPQIEGIELLALGLGVIDEYFEDPRLRNPRQDIFGQFRHGVIDSAEAAQRFINEQQTALNDIFG